MRALVTGTEGFAGSHLVEHLLECGDEVWGTIYEKNNTDRLAHVIDQITLRIGDLGNPDFIRSILQSVNIDVIYHLGGMTFVPVANENPVEAFRINLMGSIYLLEAVRRISPRIKVLIVSSAEVYGNVESSNLPVNESHSLNPRNITAASKAALEQAVRPYIQLHDLHTIIARPFNHTGTRQDTNFVCPSFAEQISVVEHLQHPVIRVGDLSVIRDFSDVRDIVRAYRLLIQKGTVGEIYNVASGVGRSVRDVLSVLLNLARLNVEIVVDPLHMRKIEVRELYGDISKIQRETGWVPKIPFETTMRDLLNYHRGRYQAKEGVVNIQSHPTRILHARESVRRESNNHL